MVAPTGQAPAGTMNLYLVRATAHELSDPVYGINDLYYGSPNYYYNVLPTEWLQINGQTL